MRRGMNSRNICKVSRSSRFFSRRGKRLIDKSREIERKQQSLITLVVTSRHANFKRIRLKQYKVSEARYRIGTSAVMRTTEAGRCHLLKLSVVAKDFPHAGTAKEGFANPTIHNSSLYHKYICQCKARNARIEL